MSDKKPQVITAYTESSFPTNQSQSGSGQDHAIEPQANHTQLERWTRDGKPFLEEYRGNGKLEGKAALITGGDSGIGRTVAIFFAREGADITISYLPEEEKDAQQTKELVEAAGKKILLIPGDLKSQEYREKLVQEHIKAFGYIDILVNNASRQVECKDLTKIDMSSVEETFQTNIIQMIGLTKVALPHLKRGSNIINTSSVTAYKGSPGMVDYSSSKGAIVAFTRALANQLLEKGIRVNSVAPGPVLTPLQHASRTGDEMENWGVGSVPLHSRVGQPAELGESYVYLATSNLSSGTVLHPNSAQHFIA